MTVPVRATAEAREALATSTPNAVGRYAEAEEIAEVVAFLVGLQGGYVLGQISLSTAERTRSFDRA